MSRCLGCERLFDHNERLMLFYILPPIMFGICTPCYNSADWHLRRLSDFLQPAHKRGLIRGQLNARRRQGKDVAMVFQTVLKSVDTQGGLESIVLDYLQPVPENTHCLKGKRRITSRDCFLGEHIDLTKTNARKKRKFSAAGFFV